MKKLLLSIFTFLLVCSLVTNAQVRSNVLKTSLTSPFLSTYVIAYERVISPDMGAQLGFYYTQAKTLGVKFSGYAITPEFRYYLSEDKDAPSGAFVAPFFRYQSFTLEEEVFDTGAKATFTGIGGGVLIGVQRVFKDRITLSAFIGPSYIKPDIKYEDPANTLDFDRNKGTFWARSGVNLGVAF